MVAKLLSPLVAFMRMLRDFVEVHPAVYTFNPRRDEWQSPRPQIEIKY
jgi:hypothetical protein